MRGKCKQQFDSFQGHPSRPELIDFPCSDDWQDYYCKHGYSSVRGARERPTDNCELRILRRENISLRGKLDTVSLKLRFLKEENERLGKGEKPKKNIPQESSGDPFMGVPEDHLCG